MDYTKLPLLRQSESINKLPFKHIGKSPGSIYHQTEPSVVQLSSDGLVQSKSVHFQETWTVDSEGFMYLTFLAS